MWFSSSLAVGKSHSLLIPVYNLVNSMHNWTYLFTNRRIERVTSINVAASCLASVVKLPNVLIFLIRAQSIRL